MASKKRMSADSHANQTDRTAKLDPASERLRLAVLKVHQKYGSNLRAFYEEAAKPPRTAAKTKANTA